jgi:hypothetical protein
VHAIFETLQGRREVRTERAPCPAKPDRRQEDQGSCSGNRARRSASGSIGTFR